MALLQLLLKIQCFILLLTWPQLASAQGSTPTIIPFIFPPDPPAQFPPVVPANLEPYCPGQCGSITIPYPFGIGDGCFISVEFEIICNNGVPLYGSIPVQSISVLDGQMTIKTTIARTCSEESDERPVTNLSKFTVSNTKNVLISIGCDTLAYINGNPPIGKGCSGCSKNEDITDDGSCNGMGCCKTSIPPGLTHADLTVERQYPRKNTSFNNPCSYAFITEESSFRFSSSYLQDFKNNGTEGAPVVLDWTIGSGTCSGAACGTNAICITGNNETAGYRCTCKSGYSGNPYLISKGGHCEDLSKSESYPRSEFNKILAGTSLSLSLLLIYFALEI